MSSGGESEPSRDAYSSAPGDISQVAPPEDPVEAKVKVAEGMIALAAGAAEYEAQQKALQERRRQAS